MMLLFEIIKKCLCVQTLTHDYEVTELSLTSFPSYSSEKIHYFTSQVSIFQLYAFIVNSLHIDKHTSNLKVYIFLYDCAKNEPVHK